MPWGFPMKFDWIRDPDKRDHASLGASCSASLMFLLNLWWSGHPVWQILCAGVLFGFALGVTIEAAQWIINRRAGQQVHAIEGKDALATGIGGLASSILAAFLIGLAR